MIHVLSYGRCKVVCRNEQLIEITARLKAEAKAILSPEERKKLNILPRIDAPGTEPSADDSTLEEFVDGLDLQKEADEFLYYAKKLTQQMSGIRRVAEHRAAKATPSTAPKAVVTKLEPKR